LSSPPNPPNSAACGRRTSRRLSVGRSRGGDRKLLTDSSLFRRRRRRRGQQSLETSATDHDCWRSAVWAATVPRNLRSCALLGNGSALIPWPMS